MNKAHDAVDASLKAIDRLRRILKKSSNLPQVRAVNDKSLIKATGLSWFNNYRPSIESVIDGDLLQNVDTLYKDLISASDRSCTRARYDEMFKAIRHELSIIRGYTLTPALARDNTNDDLPDFASLIADPKMKEILERRWKECFKCIIADAPLAATVMMGGLLEALLLARINKETNKAAVFGATTAPKDKTTGKSLNLKEWTLRNYIDVAHELKWISQSAKDVGDVLRDFRNYVHPQKELSHGVIIIKDDAILFWEIVKNITRQIL